MSLRRVLIWSLAIFAVVLVLLFHPSIENFFKTYPVPSGAILAAVITVSGVLLSNWDNTRRLRIQLDHDRHEKAREREFKLRQEVYLKFLGEAAKLKQFLGKLQSFDGSDLSLELDSASLSIATSQVSLAAEPETSKNIGLLGAHYAGIVIRMLLSQRDYYDAKLDAGLADDSCNSAHSEVVRIQERISQLVESGNPDRIQLETLQRAREAKREQHRLYRDDLEKAHKRQAVERARFPGIMRHEFSAVVDLEVAVVDGMRRDLGIDASYASSAQDSRAVIDQLSSDLEGMIGSLQEEQTPKT